MNKLITVLFSSMRTKFIKYYSKIKRWTNTTFITNRFFVKIRQGLVSLYDVRPKHEKDYYTVFLWLVSKRLAFALTIVLGILCLWYIVAFTPIFSSSTGGISTYYYNAIPLKFKDGSVRILGEGGYIAYEGQVENMQCEGAGTLYSKEGNLVYQGDFAQSKFNGSGTSYFSDGTVEYQGSFVDNLYHGKGEEFFSSGTMRYQGDFVTGLWSGQGLLYNQAGKLIFTGSFLKGNLVYNEFLDKSSAEISEMYSGKTAVYSGDEEYCVAMTEIDALYALGNGSNSLEESWDIQRIYVMDSVFYLEGSVIESINDATALFGEPEYKGTSWVDLSEAVALNLLSSSGNHDLGSVNMNITSIFDDVFTVNSYDKEIQVYLYGYERNGLVYTFYTGGAGLDGFELYAIELA